MKKFMALYMAPASTIAEMMKATAEQMKSGMDEWTRWSAQHKAAIVDLGTPLGRTKRIAKSGVADARNDVTGYSIVQGDSLDAVAAIFRDHPHLVMAGATIELIEAVAIPGM